MRHELFPVAELPAGQMRSVTVGNVAIVVVHTAAGNLHALRDRCSHRGATLSRGSVERVIVGDDVGSYELSADYLLRCPWHGFEFDVRTGRCLADPDRDRVRTYEVGVENGMVVLER